MKLTFVSNYINHHQIPLCERLSEAYGPDFSFIETSVMSRERSEGGWETDARALPYVRSFQDGEETCRALFLDSDVVLLGWSSLPATLIDRRLSAGKITLRISERIYKEGQWKAVTPRGLKAKYEEHFRYRQLPVYMLCADAYAASDFRLIRSYPGKLFRWGYFPETQTLSRTVRTDQKTLRLCWAGRMLNWKHPEYAIRAARTLHNRRYNITLTMIGDGPMRQALEDAANRYGISEHVVFKGAVRAADARSYINQSDVFLFTSSFLEGWGAVVNEAMNGGCAIVASEEAGSVPYLVKNEVNGLTYNNNSYREFEKQVLRLAGDTLLRERLGQAAYRTITGRWNAEEASRRLILFCERLLAEKKAVPFHDDGPLSVAPFLSGPALLRTLREHTRQDHGEGYTDKANVS